MVGTFRYTEVSPAGQGEERPLGRWAVASLNVWGRPEGRGAGPATLVEGASMKAVSFAAILLVNL